MNEENTPNVQPVADSDIVTSDQMLEIDANFNLASLLGFTIMIAAYDLKKHKCEAEGLTFRHVGKHFRIDEVSIDSQVEQLTALYVPEIYNLLKESALYDMFLIAADQFSFDKERLANDILTPLDKRKISVAWVVAKRVFAHIHTDEALQIISATEDDVTKAKPMTFKPMDDEEKQFLLEVCAHIKFDPHEDDDQVEKTLETLSQMPHSDITYIPTSKAFRYQKKVSVHPGDVFLSVDNKNPATEISMRINVDDGRGALTEFDIQIEAAIGSMLQKFRSIPGNEHAPIHVSSDQIYREFAGFDSTHRVTQEQRETTSKAVEKLIHTPATLDITEQIKRHTGLQIKPQYEFFKKGKVSANLVTGSHSQRYYNGRLVEDSFTIHEIPMLYKYSSLTSQIAAIDKKLISCISAASRQRSGIDDVNLRRHLLIEINRIKQDKKKKNAAITRNNQKKAKSDQQKLCENYTETLRFDTIAKTMDLNTSTTKLERTLREKVYDYLQELVKSSTIKEAEYKIVNRRYIGVSVTV